MTDQGSNNVVIAATGTGVTLTATPQGEGVDNDGHYWKYSLVPDTASYATQAIRYNTVTVTVNGAKVGSQYQAEWSPDVVLGGGDSLPYTMDEVQDIIRSCSDPILALPENGHENELVYTSLPASARFQCGTDVATSLRPNITLQNATAPTEATIDTHVTGTPNGIVASNASVDATDPGTRKKFLMQAALTVDVVRTGGVRYENGVYIVKGYPEFPSATGTENGHKIGYYNATPGLGLTSQPNPTAGDGYHTSAGIAGFHYIQYVAKEKRTYVSSAITLTAEGEYDVATNGTGALAQVQRLAANFTLTNGWNGATIKDVLVVTEGDDLSSCDATPGVSPRWLMNDAAKSAFTCVSDKIHPGSSFLYQSRTADDLFGSVTHPALSGVWRFYMDVQ
ncbi:hypothetical protein K7Z63_004656 [Salmonella enterica]|nr:hypothetical protein [Salmonella enterica]